MTTDAPSRARDLIVDMLEQDPWSPGVERQTADLAPDAPVYREMESMADGLVIAVARQWGEEDPATVAEEVVDHFGSQEYAGPDGEPAPEFLIVRTALACLVSMGVVAPQWTTLATTFGQPTLKVIHSISTCDCRNLYFDCANFCQFSTHFINHRFIVWLAKNC